MYIKDIISVLEELSIDTAELYAESTLGADAQLDSQEIVELRDQLNCRFGIRIPERALKKASTLADAAQLVADLVAAKAASQPPAAPEPAAPATLPMAKVSAIVPAAAAGSQFEGSCSTKVLIERPRDVVYGALLNAAAWPGLLPHVTAIDMLYDDREYQEFIMHVKSSTGLLQVRSIRHCLHNTAIDFFQPSPPPFLRHHCGGWIFRDLASGGTEVETFHRWNVKEEVARTTFQGPKPHTEQIRDLLLEHAQFALACWRDILTPKAA